MDSPLMRFMTKVADLMILNFLFLLCSLPVITMGASWTALYYVTMKLVRDEEGGTVKSFFRAFRLNFRQATLIWLGVLALLAFIVADLLILARIDSPLAAAGNTFMVVLAVLLLMLLQYLFPMLARFEVTVVNCIRNSALLVLSNLPKTILLTAATAGSVFITLYNEYTLSYGLPVWLVLGFALLAFGNSAILVKIFDGISPQNDKEN